MWGLCDRNGWYDPLIHYQAFYNFTVSPGNTYDYSPFNTSIQEMLYNNLYGKGNCVDQVKDCYARGLDAVCAAAVCAFFTPFLVQPSLYPSLPLNKSISQTLTRQVCQKEGIYAKRYVNIRIPSAPTKSNLYTTNTPGGMNMISGS